nr:SDR family NAD(P)-dependent oxidoreductase [Streptomyces sp. RLB1-33]QIY76140.1 SDR family NAD(P)-dependent oxidoreductase [Streptomyces sp. RLB1-33]
MDGHRGGAVFARLDVTSEPDWTAVVATAEAVFGSVSVLVDSVARAIVGTFLGRRAAVPSMRRRGGGSIVSINSAAGIGAEAGLAAYGTSKWGIRELTRISAKELAGRTSVSTACTPTSSKHPGPTTTPTRSARSSSPTAATYSGLSPPRSRDFPDWLLDRTVIPAPGMPLRVPMKDISRA